MNFSDGVDDRGEDRLLRVAAKEFVLQITTAPQEPDFWRDAHVCSAIRNIDIPDAVNWLRKAIQEKARDTPPVERRGTLLAIDVRYAGALTREAVTSEYLRSFGCPVVEFDFASVWIVGPTSEYCVRLGYGHP